MLFGCVCKYVWEDQLKSRICARLDQKSYMSPIEETSGNTNTPLGLLMAGDIKED